MKSLKPHRNEARRRSTSIAVLLCVLVSWLSVASAATVRDNFETRSWSNNDGSEDWVGDWIEVDGNATPPSPTSGNARITTGGELRLDDRPDTGGDPGVARQANLAGATSATLRFQWRTSPSIEASDSVVVEVSSNGGSSWTTLRNFTGLDGGESGTDTYDITAFATANTQVRIRVNAFYGGWQEFFFVEFIEIDYQVLLSGTDLGLSQSDTPDPVNVASSLAYTLTASNNGPEDATGVSVIDTLPAGVVFQSASATQGSCSQAAGVVSCLLGDIAAGSSATINIAVTAPFTTGTITNSATISGNELDPISGNNTSDENTVVQNLNVNQLCYLVADSGGGNGGNDLFTRVDTGDFDPATNETSIGTGTGTSTIEAIAFNSATGIVYAADANRLGVLSTSTGLFQPLPQTFGTGGGLQGTVSFTDIDGLAYDATTGVLYGAHRRTGGGILFQIDMGTGSHVPNAFGAGVDYVLIQPVLGNWIVDDLAVDPTTGTLYAATNNGGSTDRLVIVNKSTGATTDVALITVPDIEGLGTDPSGQLWGTSGTQGILYEIDKFTGVGSNGRTINNGSDYESVDCFAFSPTITADLNVGKTVDDATPAEGAAISYTVTVNNLGPGPATVVQVMDLLPAGVSFFAASPGQGTYDPVAGDWYVGSLPAGASASLVLQALVDAGTGGSTISNTASVEFLSQVDPNAANDSATVEIVPVGSPNITVVKGLTTLEDPVNGTTDPKAIPGATIRYLIVTTNTGSGQADTDSVFVTDPVPANMALRVIDYDGTTPGPVQFADGATSSGLSYRFVALDDPDDDIAFSDDGGATFDYEPAANADGVDPAVTTIRINPKGDLAGSTGAGDPSMQISFKAVVQ